MKTGSYTKLYDSEFIDGEVQPPSYIGPNTIIKKNAEVGPYTIILQNSKVDESVKIVSSVLFEKSIISRGSYIKGSVIGEGVYIGKWVRIEYGSVIGDYVYIGDEIYISKNVKIGPHREIYESIYEEGKVLP